MSTGVFFCLFVFLPCVFQRIPLRPSVTATCLLCRGLSVPSRALSASTASTAARTASVATADCATTSQDSASARPASADAGTQCWSLVYSSGHTLIFISRTPNLSVVHICPAAAASNNTKQKPPCSVIHEVCIRIQVISRKTHDVWP